MGKEIIPCKCWCFNYVLLLKKKPNYQCFLIRLDRGIQFSSSECH